MEPDPGRVRRGGGAALITAGPESGTVLVDGRLVGLEFGRHGLDPSRPTLILVHGTGGSRAVWSLQFGPLDREVNLVAVDLPGHGLTPGPAKTSIGDLAQWVADLVAGLDLPAPPVLGGVSLGGAVVLESVLSRPGLAAGLMLISSSAYFGNNGGWRETLRHDRAEGIQIWAQSLFSSGTHPGTVRQTQRILSRVPLDLILADLSAGAGFDRRARLGEVGVPALVLCGAEDRITPPEASRLLAAGLPDARLEMLDGAGHLVLVEKPGAVNRIILKFIKEKVPPVRV